MRRPEPCTLETPQVRLEPMTVDHAAALEAARRLLEERLDAATQRAHDLVDRPHGEI